MYVLGERLADDAFQDDVLAGIIDVILNSDKYPPGRAIRITYSGTSSKSSPARQLMVDLYVHAGSRHWIELGIFLKDTCTDFVEELVTGFLRDREDA